MDSSYSEALRECKCATTLHYESVLVYYVKRNLNATRATTNVHKLANLKDTRFLTMERSFSIAVTCSLTVANRVFSANNATAKVRELKTSRDTCVPTVERSSSVAVSATTKVHAPIISKNTGSDTNQKQSRNSRLQNLLPSLKVYPNWQKLIPVYILIECRVQCTKVCVSLQRTGLMIKSRASPTQFKLFLYLGWWWSKFARLWQMPSVWRVLIVSIYLHADAENYLQIQENNRIE